MPLDKPPGSSVCVFHGGSRSYGHCLCLMMSTNPLQAGIGALNGGIIKVPCHGKLRVSLEKGQNGIYLGSKLLFFLDLEDPECFRELTKVEQDTMIHTQQHVQ